MLNEGSQELAGALVGDGAGIIDQSGFEADIGLATHHKSPEVPQNLTQVLLRDRCASAEAAHRLSATIVAAIRCFDMTNSLPR